MAENPKINPQELRGALKDVLKDSGDFNDILKDSIRSIASIAKAYDGVLAKVDSLNKATINTKQLENELYKAKQKNSTTTRQLANLESKLSADQKKSAGDFIEKLKRLQEKESQLQKARISGDKAAIKELGKQHRELEASFKLQKYNLDIQEAQYIALKQQQELSGGSLDILEEQLNLEKQVSKQIGISGNLTKIFADKLGVGTEAYEAMTLKARELVDQNGKVTNLSKWKVAAVGLGSIFKNVVSAAFDPAAIAILITKLSKSITSSLSKAGGVMSTMGAPDAAGNISKLTSGISGFLKNIPFIGGLLGGAVDLMSGFADFAINAASNVQKMGRELGLSAKEARILNNEFSNYANATNDVLVNSRKLFENQIELANQLGIINQISSERLATDIKLKEIAGLDIETRSSLVQSSVILGKNQKDIMNSVFAQVKGLKQATGIQLNQKQILGEASKLGGFLGLTFAKYPSQLTKSLVSIKAMGLELKQLDSIADSFLDFESSITSEFEAQVLTGKQINLNKARELFLNNDLAGAAAEITSQIGSASDFLNLNRIQAESIARAFGMSRDDMADMLKKQEYMALIGAKQTDNAKKQYELAVKKYVTQEAMTAALGEEATQAIISANANERIANFIDKIKQGFADLVANSGITKFIDKALNFLQKPDSIKTIVNGIKDFFATVLDVTGAIVGGIIRFTNKFTWNDVSEDTIKMIEGAGSNIRNFSLGSLPTVESISETKAAAEAGTRMQSNALIPATNVNRVDGISNRPIIVHSVVTMDGQPIASATGRAQNTSATPQLDGQVGRNANQSLG